MARPRLEPGTYGQISSTKAGSGVWKARARYRDLLGEYHAASAKGPTKTGATELLREKLDRLTGQATAASVTTVGELCRDWLKRIETESEAFWSRPDAADRTGNTPPKPQSIVHKRRAVDYICAKDGGIGELRLNEVTTHLLETWLEGHKQISRGRAANILTALRDAFRRAVRLGLLATDPVAGVSPVEQYDPRPVALEAEELRTIRQVLRYHPEIVFQRRTVLNLDALLVLLLGTGLRIGEAIVLRWSDLKLTGSDPWVSVTGTQVVVPGKPTYRQEVPKTDSSNRIVLMPDVVAEALRNIRPPGWRADGWVFPSRNGTAWNSGNIASNLMKVVEKAGDQLDPSRVSFHKLRSTAATVIAEGYDDHIAGQVLGHKPKGVTQSHYIARRRVAPDVRDVLEELVLSSDPDRVLQAVSGTDQPAKAAAPRPAAAVPRLALVGS